MKSLLIEIPVPQVTDCNIHVDIIPAPQGYWVIILYEMKEPEDSAETTLA